jgi:hypothetical protein
MDGIKGRRSEFHNLIDPRFENQNIVEYALCISN